jgi:hypothetical protein
MKTPSTDCCPREDSQGDKTTDDAPVCETKQRELESACSGLVLHKHPRLSFNKYMSNGLMLLLTKSMMAKQSKDLFHFSNKALKAN